jgi:hypothetical protein
MDEVFGGGTAEQVGDEPRRQAAATAAHNGAGLSDQPTGGVRFVEAVSRWCAILHAPVTSWPVHRSRACPDKRVLNV